MEPDLEEGEMRNCTTNEWGKRREHGTPKQTIIGTRVPLAHKCNKCYLLLVYKLNICPIIMDVIYLCHHFYTLHSFQ